MIKGKPLQKELFKKKIKCWVATIIFQHSTCLYFNTLEISYDEKSF